MEQTLLFRSKDGGKTWSQPEKLDLLGREPYLTVLPDGTLFITGASAGRRTCATSGATPAVSCTAPRIADSTWESIRIESEGIKPRATNHSTRNVLRLADGTLLLGVDTTAAAGRISSGAQRTTARRGTRPRSAQPKDFQSKYGFFGGETWLWQAKSGKIWALVRVDSNELPIKDRPIKAKNDQSRPLHPLLLRRRREDLRPRPRLRRLRRDVYVAAEASGQTAAAHLHRARSASAARRGAIPGVETDDGFEFDFAHDRIMLDTKTGSRYQGGGFGPTVQLDDGTLVTSCSYRGEDDKTHLEVIRWKLPAAGPGIAGTEIPGNKKLGTIFNNDINNILAALDPKQSAEAILADYRRARAKSWMPSPASSHRT